MLINGTFPTQATQKEASAPVKDRLQQELKEMTRPREVEVDFLAQLNANISELSALQAKSRFMMSELTSLTKRF